MGEKKPVKVVKVKSPEENKTKPTEETTAPKLNDQGTPSSEPGKQPVPNNEVPVYKKWWFWLIAAGFLLALVALLAPKGANTESSSNTTTGTTGVPTPVTTTAAPVYEDVVLLDSGYSMSKDGDYIYWAAEFQNPEGNSTAYEYTKILITAYDETGAVLATDDQTMNRIQPGEKQVFGSLMSSNGKAPSKVEFMLEIGNPITPSDSAIKSSDLEVSGVTERNKDYGGVAYTGTLKNNSSSDAEQVCVTVALRQDGKLVYAENTFIDNLAAGQQKPFEINEYNVPAHNSYEIIAFDWSF